MKKEKEGGWSTEPMEFVTGDILYSGVCDYPVCQVIVYHMFCLTDDTEVPKEDLSRVQIDEEGGSVELELAISRTRKLRTKTQRVNTIKDIAERVQVRKNCTKYNSNKIVKTCFIVAGEGGA